MLLSKSFSLALWDEIFHNHIHIKFMHQIEFHYKEAREMDCSGSMSRLQFMTNTKSILSRRRLSPVFLHPASGRHGATHIHFTSLSPIIISHL